MQKGTSDFFPFLMRVEIGGVFSCPFIPVTGVGEIPVPEEGIR